MKSLKILNFVTQFSFLFFNFVELKNDNIIASANPEIDFVIERNSSNITSSNIAHFSE